MKKRETRKKEGRERKTDRMRNRKTLLLISPTVGYNIVELARTFKTSSSMTFSREGYLSLGEVKVFVSNHKTSE